MPKIYTSTTRRKRAPLLWTRILETDQLPDRNRHLDFQQPRRASSAALFSHSKATAHAGRVHVAGMDTVVGGFIGWAWIPKDSRGSEGRRSPIGRCVGRIANSADDVGPVRDRSTGEWQPEWTCLRCNAWVTSEHPMLQQVPAVPCCAAHGPRTLALDIAHGQRGWV